MTTIPERLLSQLAHVDLVNPDPERSARFFHDVPGLEESARDGRSIYFRGWGERFLHNLMVTEGPEALGHIGWRAAGPEGLMHLAQRLDASGHGAGRVDPVTGHGPAYRFRGPGGHVEEVFWEVEHFRARGELAPVFLHRPQRYHPRGVAVRQIDHMTIPTSDIFADAEFRRNVLGFWFSGWTGLPDDPERVIFALCTTNEQAHDLGLVLEPSAHRGRLNHVAFWVDQPEDVLRGAGVLLDYDVPLEYGPGRHGMGEIEFIYFREPGGARIELDSGGYRNYEPDLETVRWTQQAGSNDWYRKTVFPDSTGECFPHPGSMRHAWRRSSPSTTTDRPAGSGTEVTVCLQ
jgi:catechol 2,3-dioxygenase